MLPFAIIFDHCGIQSVCCPYFQADHLVAYQIAFDMYEGATQHFLSEVTDVLRSSVLLLHSDTTETVQTENGQAQEDEK